MFDVDLAAEEREGHVLEPVEGPWLLLTLHSMAPSSQMLSSMTRALPET